MWKPFVPVILFLFILGCQVKHTKAKAFIKVRKKHGSDSLQLYYDFVAAGKLFSDSAFVKNTILASDTIWVSYPQNDPLNANILLP